MIYTERLVAMNLIVGKAFALVAAASLSRRLGWDKVLFECDSFVVCKDVLSMESSLLWAASGMVDHVRQCLEERREWKVAWVSHRCNLQAHVLAK